MIFRGVSSVVILLSNKSAVSRLDVHLHEVHFSRKSWCGLAEDCDLAGRFVAGTDGAKEEQRALTFPYTF